MTVSGAALYAMNGGEASLTVEEITINSEGGGASATTDSSVILGKSGHTKSITINAGSEDSLACAAVVLSAANSGAIVAAIADMIDITANGYLASSAVSAIVGTVILGDSNSDISLSASASYGAVMGTNSAEMEESYVEVNGKSLTITADAPDARAVFVQSETSYAEAPDNAAKVVINSAQTTITSSGIGLQTDMNGQLIVNGDLTVDAE